MHDTTADAVAGGRAALIVIDVQNDYCHAEGKFAQAVSAHHVDAAARLAARLPELVSAMRRLGNYVIFVRTEHRRELMSDAYLDRYRQGRPLMFCEPGTWGAEFMGVDSSAADAIVTKYRYDAFYNTPLDTVLRISGRDVLVFAGFSTNVCVETSVREACIRDYRVVVLRDFCACTTKEEHEVALRVMSGSFAEVVAWADIRPDGKVLQAGNR
jgi:ureidoacrylate peracid hydrolase